MSTDVDLRALQTLWRSGSEERPSGADLRDRVARETRRRKLAWIGPALVSVAIGGWTLSRAIASPAFDNILLAAESWTFIAVAWLGSLWIDRGTRQPLADTTAAFVDISIRRCRSTLGGLRLAAVMYLVHFPFILFWKLRYSSIELTDLLASWPVIVLGWIGGPALFVFVAWYGRAKRAELQRLLDLQRQATEN